MGCGPKTPLALPDEVGIGGVEWISWCSCWAEMAVDVTVDVTVDVEDEDGAAIGAPYAVVLASIGECGSGKYK